MNNTGVSGRILPPNTDFVFDPRDSSYAVNLTFDRHMHILEVEAVMSTDLVVVVELNVSSWNTSVSGNVSLT